ncbi:MAG: hypothetical protein ACPGWS_06705, partial [Solirubrobacterales bacterium]
TKLMLKAIADKNVGSREQSQAWIWALAGYTRELHEQYAVQRWPETKRLLGLLVNSSGPAHGRNARRIVQETRKQDLRLAASILAAAVSHSPEAEEALRGGRNRLARKPAALARELGRNFPKARGRKGRRRQGDKKSGKKRVRSEAKDKSVDAISENGSVEVTDKDKSRKGKSQKAKSQKTNRNRQNQDANPKQRRRPRGTKSTDESASPKSDSGSENGDQPKQQRRPRKKPDADAKSDKQEKSTVPVLGSFEELSRGE